MSHQQGIRFTDPQAEFLRAEAKRLGITVSDLIRRIIDQHRDKREQTEEHTMADAQRIAERWNFVIGKLGYSDSRRYVQETGEGYTPKPYYVARDGHIIRQFPTATARANWLEEYDLLNEPRSYPDHEEIAR